MEYIVMPTKDKSETTFFLDLLRKMQKDVVALSASKIEDIAFIAALRESEHPGKAIWIM